MKAIVTALSDICLDVRFIMLAALFQVIGVQQNIGRMRFFLSVYFLQCWRDPHDRRKTSTLEKLILFIQKRLSGLECCLILLGEIFKFQVIPLALLRREITV